MPHKNLIRTADAPYHVTARTNNRDFYDKDLQTIWNICGTCLAQATSKYSCHVHGFVLMSNHYHLLISTPEKNLDEVMLYFNREVAKRTNKVLTRINHFFGGRYKWSLIYEEAHYWNVLKYIFRNPVKAGICSKVDLYRYSSLNTDFPHFQWKMVDFFRDPNQSIALDKDWLNEPVLMELNEAIRKGLARREFKTSRLRRASQIEFNNAIGRKKVVTTY